MQSNDEYEVSLQNDIDNSKDTVVFGNALARLLKNPDFITVIQKDYCQAHTLSLVSLLKADATSDDTRFRVMGKLEAVSLFQEYLRAKTMICSQAIQTAKDAQEELDNLRGEA